MSWLFSRALVEEYSVENCSDGKPFAPLNVMPTVQRFWLKDKMTKSWNLSLFGLTWKLLTEHFGMELLMLYRQASRVNRSQSQEKENKKKTNEICGPKQYELFPRSGQDSFCLKMCQAYANTCPWSYETCEEMATQLKGQRSFRQKKSEQSTRDAVSGLWPTLTTRDYRNSSHRERNNKAGLDLIGFLCVVNGERAIRLKPTFAEEFMGWPTGWTELEPLETAKYLEWLERHGTSCAQEAATENQGGKI